MTYRLAIDLGTTFTAAAVAEGGPPTIVGLGNRALQIPSVLFLPEDGDFLVGEAAETRGFIEPTRSVREFKRRLGDPVPILVAGRPFSPQSLTARLLRWVVTRSVERMGEAPAELVLTHPANWAQFKLGLFHDVAELADVGPIRLCPEPQAAAAQYAARNRVGVGSRLAIYDLGGGTFDVCVLEKTHSGFSLLGKPAGVEHLGGIDFDEAIFNRVLLSLSASIGDLGIDDPSSHDDPQVVAALARLRRTCIEAKEALSSDVDATVPVSWLGHNTSVRVTRAEFESLIRPKLEETASAVHRALRSAQVEPAGLDAIVLVGGSSRIPLVAEIVQASFGVPLALDIHPKHDVVLGALLSQPVRAPGSDRVGYVAAGATPAVRRSENLDPADEAPTRRPSAEVPESPLRQDPEPRQPASRQRRGLLAVAATLALAGVVVAVILAVAPERPIAAPPPAASSVQPHVWPVSPEPLPDYVVVSAKRRAANWDVEALDVRGETPVRTLVGGPEQDTFPVLSPDRRTVAYLRYAAETYALRVVSANGEGDTEMLAEPPADCVSMKRPAWGVNNLLALPCEDAQGETLLSLVGPDGAVIRRLDRGDLGDPTFTLDGGSVVYWRSSAEGDGGALHQIAVDGQSESTPLTDGADGQDNDPACSPDGSRVAFTRTVGRFKSIAIVTLGADSPQSPTLVTIRDFDQDPSWSPDSNRIVFKRGPDENADLYLVDSAGGPVTPLVDDDEPDTTPAWTAR